VTEVSYTRCVGLRCYRTLQPTLGYTVIWRTWMINTGRNFASKIAAEQLEVATWFWQSILARHRPIQRRPRIRRTV